MCFTESRSFPFWSKAHNNKPWNILCLLPILLQPPHPHPPLPHLHSPVHTYSSEKILALAAPLPTPQHHTLQTISLILPYILPTPYSLHPPQPLPTHSPPSTTSPTIPSHPPSPLPHPPHTPHPPITLSSHTFYHSPTPSPSFAHFPLHPPHTLCPILPYPTLSSPLLRTCSSEKTVRLLLHLFPRAASPCSPGTAGRVRTYTGSGTGIGRQLSNRVAW